MSPIEVKNNTFLINTRSTSYLFEVGKYGHLEHIHYGDQADLEDAKALSLKHCLQYGTTIPYSEKDMAYSLDHIPQEFGTYGRGDFRRSAIEVEYDGSYTCDFIYDSFEKVTGDVKIDGLPDAYGADETLIVHLKDAVNKLSLDLYYAVYFENDVIVRRSVLTNNGDGVCHLHRLSSCCLDMFEDGLELMDFSGAWNKETHIGLRNIARGTLELSSTVGSSSAKHNPGFILKKKKTGEDSGEAWGFNLIYSGNHRSTVSYDEYGIVRVLTGVSDDRFDLALKPQESFSTPSAVLSYSHKGLNGLSSHFHDFINEHVVRSNWKNKPRPILINSWEGFGFNFKKDKLIKLAASAKKLGIELFVLDDGWFGRRNSDERGLGDYDCNLKKIPGGIKSLSSEIHKMGMLFGIWVEPEAISIDSALYEKHPEYAMVEKGRKNLFGRHELLMDLTNPEVQDYIVENVSKLIDENEVDYIKWDMNRLMNGVSGVYSHEYIKGLYSVLDRIFTPRPHVLFESCSSGGNRFDLGMLCYSPQIWASDDTDPIERIDIQKGLSYLYPLSTMGAHVSASPHMQTLRNTPLETRFTISAFGLLGYELDLDLLSTVEKAEIKRQIAYYTEHRRTFQFGRFYRFDDEELYESFEVAAGGEAIVGKFRRLVNSVPLCDRLFVKGLDKNKRYTIEARPYLHILRQFGNLINFITPVKLNAEGKIVDTIVKLKGLDSAQQKYSASGKALSYGIVLNNLFEGTGHNRHIRMPLDYGSDLYQIKEEK